MEMTKKIESLKENKEFLNKIAQMENSDEVAAAFCAEGVEVTAEEVEKARELIGKNGELSEKALEDVSGGIAGLLWGIAGVIIFASMAAGFRDGVSCRRK